jgi:hypothetical protein
VITVFLIGLPIFSGVRFGSNEAPVSSKLISILADETEKRSVHHLNGLGARQEAPLPDTMSQQLQALERHLNTRLDKIEATMTHLMTVMMEILTREKSKDHR